MAAAAAASAASSSRPTPEGVLAYVAQLQLQLHDDLVRWRTERMTRQDAALRAYVATLPVDFPFARYTHGVTTHSHATDRACVHLDASGIAPYLGVITDRPATRATFLLPYPGVVMTRREYDQMPIAVPTACDTRLHRLVQDEGGPHHNADFVLVGLPSAHGPNVMSNNDSPFVANVQLVEDEQAVRHVANTRQQTLVHDNYVFVRRTAPIAAGDELFTGAYSPDFFTTSNTSCDACFRIDAERNLLRCLDCAVRVHPRCRHAEQVEAEEGRHLPHRCRYHQRLAQIEHEREIFAADIQVDPAVESIRQFVQQKRAHGGRKVRGPFPFEGVYWLRLHDLPAPFRTLKTLFDAIRAEDKLRPIAVGVVAMHEREEDHTLVFSEHPPSHFTTATPIPTHSPDARLEWLWDPEQAARFLDECDRKAADKRERRQQHSSS